MTTHECSPLEWTASFDGTRDGPLVMHCAHGATIHPGDTITATHPRTGSVTTYTIGQLGLVDPTLARIRDWTVQFRDPATPTKSLVDAAVRSLMRSQWIQENGYAYPGQIYIVGVDAPTDTTLDDLTEAHRRVATGADPEATREALRRLADTGITAADVEHIPATLTRLFSPSQETTMHVADLNGTHLGKTITVHDDPQKITGTLVAVNHATDVILETRATGPDAHILGRQHHSLTIGTFSGEVRGHSDVEVHP